MLVFDTHARIHTHTQVHTHTHTHTHARAPALTVVVGAPRGGLELLGGRDVDGVHAHALGLLLGLEEGGEGAFRAAVDVVAIEFAAKAVARHGDLVELLHGRRLVPAPPVEEVHHTVEAGGLADVRIGVGVPLRGGTGLVAALGLFLAPLSDGTAVAEGETAEGANVSGRLSGAHTCTCLHTHTHTHTHTHM